MADVQHADLLTVHRARYIQSSDPGAVGANVEWVDTSVTPSVHKVRNAGNTAWDTFELGASNLASNAVTSAKINAAAVTYTKMQNVTASRLMGNPTGGSASPSEIPLGAGLQFSGGALVCTVSAGNLAKTGADQAINGSTLTNVTGMGFAVSASTDYLFEFFVLFHSASAGVGMGLAVTCPASPNAIIYSAHIPNLDDAGNAFWEGHGNVGGDQVTGPNVPVAGSGYLAYVRGILRNGANSGSVQLQAANETATNNVTIRRGTMYRYHVVA